MKHIATFIGLGLFFFSLVNIISAHADCTPPPLGLVAWWPAEGNANDIVNTNNGNTVGGLTYASGEAGQAFSFDGTNTYIAVPASPSLDLGVDGGFTIETWFKPTPGENGPIVEWDSATKDGLQLWISNGEIQQIAASIWDTSGTLHQIVYPYVSDTNQFHHIAYTYDKGSGQAIVYIDGTNVASLIIGNVTPQTSYPNYSLNIGRRTGQPSGLNDTYGGLIDELGLYNRALSESEIQSIYNAGSAGKCALPPECTPPPVGLVAWWPAEGNANDIINFNNGTPNGLLGYTNGEVGQAFVLDGNTYITAPASPSLDIGATGSGITIECWIKPSAANNPGGPIIEWDSPSLDGLQFWVQGDNSLWANMKHDPNNAFGLNTVSGVVDTNSWWHVAVTYDKSSGTIIIYTNGVAAASANFGNITPETTFPLNIGRRTGQPIGDGDSYAGLIDELGIYNRALSQAEIAAIYNAGRAGKCALPPECTPPPTGLISWWPGEGNAHDITSNNNGSAQNINYTNGQVGQAFVFDGSSSYVHFPTSPSLDVGQGSGLTVEAWINPASLNLQALFEWNQNNGVAYGAGQIGTHLEINEVAGDGSIWGNLVDTSGVSHNFNSGTGIILTNQFQHVAMTYDKASGAAVLYYNGAVVGTNNFGIITPQTSFDLFLGNRPSGFFAGDYFQGEMDEPSVYNRALSQAEIAAIYNAGSAGKCSPSFGPTNMVAWWPAESNALDVFGINNGTLVNGAGFVTGEAGQAFAFDGSSSYVNIPDSPSLDSFTNKITIELWLKMNHQTPNSDWEGIVTKGNTSWRLMALSGGKSVYFAAAGLTPDTGSGYAEISGSRNVNDGLWHYVATVYDGTNLSIYVDGTLDVSQPATGLISQNNEPVCIGADSQAYVPSCSCNKIGYILDGSVDEVALYNRALTAEEIQAIYNAGSAGKNHFYDYYNTLPPTIDIQPLSQSVAAGGQVVLSVTASGSGLFTYQWRFNGINISGATNSTLTLTNLHVSQTGNYSVAVTNTYGTVTSSNASVTVIPQDILIYSYSGKEHIITFSQELSYNYSGQMLLTPASTNGFFVGWDNINGKKIYWVNPLTGYLWIPIPHQTGLGYTVIGRAGYGIDTNSYPHFWSYLHRGANASLTIAKKRTFTFPNTFTGVDTHVYPNTQNGSLIQLDATSSYQFISANTQIANNTGQTLPDLINTLSKTLEKQGYQKQ